jgi:hypothetical protein
MHTLLHDGESFMSFRKTSAFTWYPYAGPDDFGLRDKLFRTGWFVPYAALHYATGGRIYAELAERTRTPC